MKYNGKKLNSVNHNSFSIQTAKPNIVFILADDLGYSSIGYEEFDLSFVSPFLTSMAKNGILMTNYYGQEICTPSRAALLTGRYPLTVGLQTGELQPVSTHGLNLTEILLPEVLRNLGGYKNYALGKWNLGHFSAQYLPTARGFDYFLGYMAGQVYYWSKHIPHYSTYKDFLFCDKNCYFGYGKDDSTTYSTFLYRDKSISLINQHDFDKNPMFLYLPFQAVHDPFDEYDGNYSTGVPRQYFEDTAVYDLIVANISGKNRQQYAMSLSLLDHAVHKIYDTLDALGQVDNTYFVFASDNGGCYEAGGRNGELRGSKGTYFEGRIILFIFIVKCGLFMCH
jgi:arylsulfatase A-like enzyme